MPVEIDGEVYPDLPSVEECVEFLRLVNVGRLASGRHPLPVLDFDDATPCSPSNCLSARNLFVIEDVRHAVGDRTVSTEPEIADALGMPASSQIRFFEIPPAIYKVTDPFDAGSPWLRDRLVEAGVVAPEGTER